MISKAVLLFLHGNRLCRESQFNRRPVEGSNAPFGVHTHVSTLTAGNKEEDDEEEGEDEGAGVASDMARGHQKFQSQQKNAKKQADIKKSKSHDQKAAAKAALVYTCTICRTQMPDPKTFKQHFESKHPKSPMPPELADVEA
ncbi:zinc finger protein 706 isoform X1 [Nelusetta ayraudi]|uniref:zinc finger protein 706 isoform X1 n=2 Tax=Nelusetta ayraudi TaxID=303726 RepID=UPI003F71786E